MTAYWFLHLLLLAHMPGFQLVTMAFLVLGEGLRRVSQCYFPSCLKSRIQIFPLLHSSSSNHRAVFGPDCLRINFL